MADTCPSCTSPVPADADTCWSCGGPLEQAGGGRGPKKGKGGGKKKPARSGSKGRFGLLLKLLLLVIIVLVAMGVGVPYAMYRTLDPCEMLSLELDRRGVASASFLVAADANPSPTYCVTDLATLLPDRVRHPLDDGQATQRSPWAAVAGSTPQGQRLAILSLPSVPGEGDAAVLSLQCEGGGMSVLIDWRAPMGSVGSVAWRVGGGTSFTEPWPLGEGGTSTLFPGDARQLFGQLESGAALVVAVSPPGQRTRTATFQPTGLGLEVLALREACGR